MTTDYEKRYNEALERARKALSEIPLESYGARKIIIDAFPELAESDDERIRKHLVAIVELYWGKTNDPDKAKDLAWLKKQKENIEKEYVFRPLAGTDITIAAEQAIRRANEGDRLVLAFNGAYIPVRKGCNANKIVVIYDAFIEKQKDASKAIEAVERIDKYIDEHLANAHDMKDSNPDKKYYRGWDDALGKMAGILQDVYSGEKQKEQMPVVAHGETYHVDTLGTQQFIAGKMPQKSAEWSKNDTVFLNEITDFFENKTVRLQHDIDMYAHWLKSLPERLVLQPKAEWSEEDDMMRDNIISVLSAFVGTVECESNPSLSSSYPTYRREIDWLKSLPLNLKKKNEDIEKLCSNEWSKEDEKIITALTKALIGSDSAEKIMLFDGVTIEMVSDWLKSLRPQPKQEKSDYITPHKQFFKWIYDRLVSVHKENPDADYMISFKKRIEELSFDNPSWKPSEEQMEALEYVIRDYREDSCNATANYLQEILDHLKNM